MGEEVQVEVAIERASVVYDGEDSVVASTGWQVGDKIHGYCLKREGPFFGGYAEGRNPQWVGVCLVLLTCGASADIFFCPFPEAWPPKVSFQKVDGAVSSWMSPGWRVMVPAKDLTLE